MIDIDKWQEIFSTIRKNKLRTFLTGFSVAWGIFMLVILLGAGNGLKNGFENDFRDDAINSIWIQPGQTSIPYNGMKSGRYLEMKNDDYDYIVNNMSGVEYSTVRFTLWNQLVSYNGQSANYTMRSVHPDHKYVENTKVTKGRFVNRLDLEDFRKVACIGQRVVTQLFGDTDPIGKYLRVANVNFKVVGVFVDEGHSREEEIVYVPVTTAQRVFNAQNSVDRIIYTTGTATLEQSQDMAERTRLIMADRLKFSPEDKRAVYINNNNEQFEKIMSVLRAIELFIWIIGVMTIVAGVVGIGNIMMIVVKERTREIGIRKALGARPSGIVALILQESVLITSIAGYFGMLSGIFLLEYISGMTSDPGIFMNPGVNLSTAISATLVLIIAGLVAGFIPAMRASRINPIEALRDE